MRKWAIAVLLSASLLVGGCGLLRGSGSGEPVESITSVTAVETNTVEGDGMILAIELPKRCFTSGENINIRIIARNTGAKTIVFENPTSALYKVTLFRMTSAGWRWVNQYPQSAMKVRSTWTLRPGQTVRYNQVIPVERDWPMGEPLRLVAELVGGPDLKCPMIISATAPPRKEP